MDDQELRTLLEQVHAEIENTHSLDDKGRELLRHLDADIRTLLERSGEKPMQAGLPTLRRLEEALDHFEASHPALTGQLSRLLEILSSTGI
jgi:hypothetical protein